MSLSPLLVLLQLWLSPVLALVGASSSMSLLLILLLLLRTGTCTRACADARKARRMPPLRQSGAARREEAEGGEGETREGPQITGRARKARGRSKKVRGGGGSESWRRARETSKLAEGAGEGEGR